MCDRRDEGVPAAAGTTVLYFAYGSNLLRTRLAARVGACAVAGYAAIAGYRLAFDKRGADGSAKCNARLTGRDDDLVLGTVYEITRAQREVLDVYEGVGRGYDVAAARTEVFAHFARRGRPAVREVVLYTARPDQVAHDLVPFDWYRDFVLYGAREHELPESYVREIERVAVVEDPDPERTARNRAVRDAPLAQVLARFARGAPAPGMHR